jgi:putative transposase
MTNHVHLLLTPQHTNGASLLMKHLGQRYAQYANRCYGRTGSLWEGRFRSCIVCDEAYVLRCYRYIELNPVRAASSLIRVNYPWSSYRFNVEGRNSGMLVAHPCYRGLGADEQARRAAYRKLVDNALESETLE